MCRVLPRAAALREMGYYAARHLGAGTNKVESYLEIRLTGRGSKLAFRENMAVVARKIASQSAIPAPPRPAADLQRAWGTVSAAVATVLGPAGELRMCDVHAAVEALLGGSVPRSTIKNCLAGESVGESRRFERVGRGKYRLAT